MRRPLSPSLAPRLGLHILAYHGINADSADHLSVPPSLFDAQMAWLRHNNFQVVSLAEGMARLRCSEELGPCVALTLDDGYADFLAHAAPILARHGFLATLFVVTRKLGGVADWAGAPRGQRLLTAHALRELVDLGHAIGSHGASHARLTHLCPADLVTELRESKGRLEKELGVTPFAFAYPYGAFRKRERDAVAAAGYACACGIRGWANTAQTDPFALRRIEMWAGYSMREYEALLTARFKWPRLTQAAKHIVGGIQHERVGRHS